MSRPAGEDLLALRRSVAEFTAAEVSSRALRLDAGTDPDGLPGILRKVDEFQLRSLTSPEVGLDLGGLAAAVEELATGCAGVATLVLLHNLGGGAAVPVLPRLQASRRDPRWLLEGEASFVPGGATADGLVVFSDSACFHVPAAAAEVRPVRQSGLRVCRSASVTFRGAEATLLAEGDEATRRRERLERELLVGLAAVAVGLARGTHDAALAYARQRRQGGRPIVEHSAVQTMLSKMIVGIESSRALIQAACEDPSNRRLPAVAKIVASEAAMQATTDGVQILGGYGYMREYGMEKRMRDAAMLLSCPEPLELLRGRLTETG